MLTVRFLLLALIAGLSLPCWSAPGEVDADFEAVAFPGFDDVAMALQPDGRFLLNASSKPDGGLWRFYPDGSADGSFSAKETVGYGIKDVLVQPDGKLLLAYHLSNGYGQVVSRLLADGSVDRSFEHALTGTEVLRLALQPNGMILVGHSNTGGQSSIQCLRRLRTDGSIDASFQPAVRGDVRAIAILADGKILVGGVFTVADKPQKNLVRLLADGRVDDDFRPNAIGGVTCLAPLPDGKILVGGRLEFIGGVPLASVARLNADGSRDLGFEARIKVGNPESIGSVNDLAVQADGKILIGGSFSSVEGVACSNVARVLANGTLDEAFVPPAIFDQADRVLLQHDGRVLVGGEIPAANRAQRFQNDPAVQNVTITGGATKTLRWLRGGSAPEILEAVFEMSQDFGRTYTRLGSGRRIAGGWELSGVALPPSGQIRASSSTAGCRSGWGRFQAVSSMVAFGRSPAPEITVQTESSPVVTLEDGGQWVLAPANPGTPITRTLTISNHGDLDLKLLAARIVGPDAGSFALLKPPADRVRGGGGSTQLVVQFTPSTVLGPQRATLQLATSDRSEHIFDLRLLADVRLSDNADLSDLRVSNRSISPAFDSQVAHYQTNVPFSEDLVDFVMVTAQAGATVRINGAPGINYGILQPGTNVFTIKVTAQDGVTEQAYTVTVTREMGTIGQMQRYAGVSLNASPLALHPDGSVVLIKTVGNQYGLARVRPDGYTDPSFQPRIGGSETPSVRALLLQPDLKIVVGGSFTQVNGEPRKHLARLEHDGSLDTGFPDLALDGDVTRLLQQRDGKIVLLGTFTAVAGEPRGGIARLNPDGTLDAAFAPVIGGGAVVCMALQSLDDRLLVGGSFTEVNGTLRQRLARLNTDGTLDMSFDPGVDATVHSLAVQPMDGKILVGGKFTMVAGGSRFSLARLLSSGAIDASFNVYTTNELTIAELLLQADGSILVCPSDLTTGALARIDSSGARVVLTNVSLFRSAVLRNDGHATVLIYGQLRHLVTGPASDVLLVQPSQITWQRGGTVPEAEEVFFDLSMDRGASYSHLGQGLRIAGGWQLTGLNLPASGQVRARARTTGGLVESVVVFGSGAMPTPEIVVQRGSVPALDGSSIDLGTIYAQEDVLLPLRIRNTGEAPLRISDFHLTGADAGMLAIYDYPQSETPGPSGESTLNLRLKSMVTGVVSATLRIESNDADEADYDITFTANVQTSRNADLASVQVLSVGSGAVSYSFAGAPEMALTVPSYVRQVTLNASTKAESVTQLLVDGNSLPSGQRSDAIDLTAGENAIPISITALDGTVKNYTLRITRPFGAVEESFAADANGAVYSTVSLSDQRLLVGGSFTTMGGSQRQSIARLLPDGAVDTTLAMFLQSSVSAFSVQADGSCLVAASHPSGAAHLFRLHPSGFVDSSFNPGLDGLVTAIAIQEDGKILVGGQFLNVGGVSRVGVARLHPDGTLDTAFDAGLTNQGAAPLVRCVALQRDGRALIGGSFTSVGGVARSYLARLETDGTLDASFAPVSSTPVNALLVLPDDRLLVGGLFSTGSYLARFASDGTLDTSYVPPVNGTVYSLALQSDGKVFVGGSFTASGGARERLLRLQSDGRLDISFDAAVTAFGNVFSTQLQPDGKLVVGSDSFRTGGTTTSRRLARLENEPATESLALTSNDRVEWLRGGCAPGEMQVRFEVSVDKGASYSLLGYGTRIAGGWELAGLTLPATGQIRASARAVGGRYNGSSYTITRTLAFGAPAVPNLVVTDTNEILLPDEAVINTTLANPGSGRNLNFVLHNTGASPLTGLAGTLDGPHAGEFSFVQPVPATLAVGDVAVVSVRFTASATGTRSAALRISSNEVPDHDLHLSAPVEFEQSSDLFSLAVTNITLAPAFAKTTTEYTLSVPFNISTLAVTARSSGAFSSIAIGSAAPVAAIAVASSVALVPGLNVIPVVVTAQDGITTKTYNLNVTRAVAEVPGDVQLPFDPQVTGGSVSAIAPQGDGKVLIGGAFTKVRGVSQRYLARLNADGTLDTSFATVVNAEVKCILVLPSGKILIGGSFSSVNQQYPARIARLNSDGTSDSSFVSPFGPGAGSVLCMALQPQDGMILVGLANGFSRLNADGALDQRFIIRPNGAVNTIVVQRHGYIVIGGDFTSINSIARNRLARISAVGGLDSFNPNIDGTVAKVLVPSQSDQADKLLVFGSYSNVQGTARQRIVRLNANGTIDSSYLAEADGVVRAAVPQVDGKVLIAGDFTAINGTARSAIARLNVNGTLDTAFNTFAPGASVSGLAQLANGQVLAGGAFTTFGAFERGNLVRLANNAATDSFAVANARQVDWLRSGAAPEFTSVTFDMTLNGGVSWIAVPAASVSRIYGGWRYAPTISLPPSGIVRAHGSTTGGTQGSSSGLVTVSAPFSGYTGPVLQVSQGGTLLIDGQTLNLGQVILGATRTITLTLKNTGNQPLTINPGDVETVAPQQAELVIIKQPASTILPGRSSELVARIRATETGTTLRHAGLRITHNDAFGGPFNLPVQLSVPDAPNLYNLGSGSRLLPAGLRHEIAFDVQTGGMPATYQWRKNGVPLSIRNATAVLQLHPVKLSDAGIYTLVVATAYGKTTSEPVNVGVVAQGPAIVRAKPGSTVTLTCQAKAPPGLALAYRWTRFDGQNDLYLTDTSKLVLPGVRSDANDIYTCYVDLLFETAPITQTVSNGDTLLIVDETPVVSPFILPPAYVGQQVIFQVPATGNPTRFSAQDLPPGMTLASDGTLSGKPLAAGLRNVSFTASNLAGSSLPVTVPWTLLPLPVNAVGTFAGLIDRAPMNEELGGYFSIATSANGSFTGYVLLGGERIPVAGVVDVPAGGGNPALRFKVRPYAPDSVLVVDTTTQSIAGDLEDGVNGSAPCAGVRNLWSLVNPIHSGFIGKYNAGLVPSSVVFSDATTYPQGTGYVQMSVLSQGTVAWIGHLSDGSVALQNVFVGPQGEVPFHASLYANQSGSLNGWSLVESRNGYVDGVLGWSKQVQPPASRARSYAAGFPLHELTLIGAKYTPPAPGMRVLGLLPSPPDNAKIAFSSGGFVSAFPQPFSVTAQNTSVMPMLNPLQVNVFLSPPSGTFTGSFTLTNNDLLDVTPPVAVVRRVTTFQGALITRPGMNKGVGYFNLAELSDATGETLSNTPQWSGKVELGAP